MGRAKGQLRRGTPSVRGEQSDKRSEHLRTSAQLLQKQLIAMLDGGVRQQISQKDREFFEQALVLRRLRRVGFSDAHAHDYILPTLIHAPDDGLQTLTQRYIKARLSADKEILVSQGNYDSNHPVFGNEAGVREQHLALLRANILYAAGELTEDPEFSEIENQTRSQLADRLRSHVQRQEILDGDIANTLNLGMMLIASAQAMHDPRTVHQRDLLYSGDFIERHQKLVLDAEGKPMQTTVVAVSGKQMNIFSPDAEYYGMYLSHDDVTLLHAEELMDNEQEHPRQENHVLIHELVHHHQGRIETAEASFGEKILAFTLMEGSTELYTRLLAPHLQDQWKDHVYAPQQEAVMVMAQYAAVERGVTPADIIKTWAYTDHAHRMKSAAYLMFGSDEQEVVSQLENALWSASLAAEHDGEDLEQAIRRRLEKVPDTLAIINPSYKDIGDIRRGYYDTRVYPIREF
jgi:hypothetical protein